MGLDGIHHVTAITADAQGTLDFYVRLHGAAAGEEDGQLRRAGHVPPLPRRRDRLAGQHPHLLRDPRRPRSGRPGAGHDPPRRLAGGASTASLDFWAERLADAGPSGRARRGRARELRPGGPGAWSSWPGRAGRRRAPRAAWAPDIPAEHALAGIVGVRAFSREPEATERLLVDGLGFVARGRRALRHLRRRAPRPLLARPAARGARRAGRGHGAPRGLDLPRRRPRRLGPARGARPAPTRRASSTASTSTRSTSASPGGCCSRSRPWARASPTDEPADRLGEELRLPPQYEPLRERIEEVLGPLASPRAPQARPPGARDERPGGGRPPGARARAGAAPPGRRCRSSAGARCRRTWRS